MSENSLRTIFNVMVVWQLFVWPVVASESALCGSKWVTVVCVCAFIHTAHMAHVSWHGDGMYDAEKNRLKGEE
jgi:hypothetical protein